MRDVGKHFTVNSMLAEGIGEAAPGERRGITYTEFSYSLLQAYDFLMLFDRSAARCRWAAATSGATSPLASISFASCARRRRRPRRKGPAGSNHLLHPRHHRRLQVARLITAKFRHAVAVVINIAEQFAEHRLPLHNRPMSCSSVMPIPPCIWTPSRTEGWRRPPPWPWRPRRRARPLVAAVEQLRGLERGGARDLDLRISARRDAAAPGTRRSACRTACAVGGSRGSWPKRPRRRRPARPRRPRCRRQARATRAASRRRPRRSPRRRRAGHCRRSAAPP